MGQPGPHGDWMLASNDQGHLLARLSSGLPRSHPWAVCILAEGKLLPSAALLFFLSGCIHVLTDLLPSLPTCCVFSGLLLEGSFCFNYEYRFAEYMAHVHVTS